MKNLETMKKYLKEIAAKEKWDDNEDFNSYDFSGGNFDDTYYEEN